MTTRTDTLLQALEKLGAPLMAAVSESQFRDQMMGGAAAPSAGAQNDAEKMAALLTRAADLGVHLSSLIDLTNTKDEGDSVRLTLTALAAPLVANIYRMTGQVPAEAATEKMKDTLASVLLFTDQFSAGADVSARLAGLEADFFPGDAHQVFAQTLSALVPAINAVAAFAFGQNEKALIQSVCNRLVTRARDLQQELMPGLPEQKAAQAGLSLLRTLSSLYAQCHFAEMAKIMSAGDGRVTPAIEPVWQAFDLRTDMLVTVAAIIAEDDAAAAPARAGGKSGGKAPAPPKADAPASGNPMSFFSKTGM